MIWLSPYWWDIFSRFWDVARSGVSAGTAGRFGVFSIVRRTTRNDADGTGGRNAETQRTQRNAKRQERNQRSADAECAAEEAGMEEVRGMNVRGIRKGNCPGPVLTEEMQFNHPPTL